MGSCSHLLELLPSPPYQKGFFTCNLCQEKGSGPVFHCPDCSFDLHLCCTASAPEETHFSHYQHALLRRGPGDGGGGASSCNLCGLRMPEPGSETTGGGGFSYQCGDCACRMHPHCARAPRYLLHRSHRHPLVLVPRFEASGGGDGHCDGCGQKFAASSSSSAGFLYHCKRCKYELHPSCVMLPEEVSLSKHPQHRLKLLVKSAYPNGRFSCNECLRKGNKWVYHCDSCDYDLHPECANLSHQCLKLLVKSAYPNGHFSCNECLRKGNKRVYDRDSCDYDLHPQCTNLFHQITARMARKTAIGNLKYKAPLEIAATNVPATVVEEESEESDKEELAGLKELQDFLKAMKIVEPLLHNLASSSLSSSSSSSADASKASLTNDTQEICPICQEVFDSRNPKKKTQCSHSFHHACILKWKETKDSCPICQQNITFVRP